MAMTTCGECGRAVSTTAAACPNCGAPRETFAPASTQTTRPPAAPLATKPMIRKPFLVVLGGIVALFLAAVMFTPAERTNPIASASQAPTPPPEPQPMAPAPPPPPTHLYSILQDGEYGYEQALSDDDTKAGRAVKPMVMVRYLGKRGGTQRWATVDGAINTVFSCKDACEFVRQDIYSGVNPVSAQTMRVGPGSILAAVVEDVQNEQLQVYGSAAAGRQDPPQAAEEPASQR